MSTKIGRLAARGRGQAGLFVPVGDSGSLEGLFDVYRDEDGRVTLVPVGWPVMSPDGYYGRDLSELLRASRESLTTPEEAALSIDEQPAYFVPERSREMEEWINRLHDALDSGDRRTFDYYRQKVKAVLGGLNPVVVRANWLDYGGEEG